jgi:hypothetical protein
MFSKFKWISWGIWNQVGGKYFRWHDPLHHKFLDHISLYYTRKCCVGNPFSGMEIPDMSVQDLVSRLWFPLTSRWEKSQWTTIGSSLVQCPWRISDSISICKFLKIYLCDAGFSEHAATKSIRMDWMLHHARGYSSSPSFQILSDTLPHINNS